MNAELDVRCGPPRHIKDTHRFSNLRFGTPIDFKELSAANGAGLARERI